jgi:hypothetical protein
MPYLGVDRPIEEDVEEDIAVVGDGVPIRHISRGYFPFYPEFNHNDSDGGPILSSLTEMREEGILVCKWRRRAPLPN